MAQYHLAIIKAHKPKGKTWKPPYTKVMGQTSIVIPAHLVILWSLLFFYLCNCWVSYPRKCLNV
jgi:hypothetical protein